MDNGYAVVGLRPPPTRLPGFNERMTDGGREQICLVASAVRIEIGSQPLKRFAWATGALKIGLIDSFRLSRECLMRAFENVQPGLTIVSSPSVHDCITEARHDLDIIIYQPHIGSPQGMGVTQDIVAIQGTFPEIPLVLFCDAEEMRQPNLLRGLLRSGARGVVPTRTTSIRLAMTAIRFVLAGGIFAPLDLLLSSGPDRTPEAPDLTWQDRLTSWEIVILFHLRQGKANKTIAQELSLSEKLVKGHIRNIMRKMGVATRTRAAYEAHKLWDSPEATQILDD
jgi:DNA-binding NarL/FixJ family response regulator